MATYLSNELAGTSTGLSTSAGTGYKPRATVYGGRVKRLRATITLASQATTDTLLLGNLPSGATFAYGVLTASASLGSSTLAIGVSGTTGKYRTAGTFTATDTPTFFGNAAQVAASDAGLSAEEVVIGTIASAALPSSGTLVVDLYYSIPN